MVSKPCLKRTLYHELIPDIFSSGSPSSMGRMNPEPDTAPHTPLLQEPPDLKVYLHLQDITCL